jgi:hypothetical protein
MSQYFPGDFTPDPAEEGRLGERGLLGKHATLDQSVLNLLNLVNAD